MYPKESLKILVEGLLGENSLVLKLRQGDGLDEDLFKQIIDATKNLILFYKNKKDVPKELALCFVDIYEAFSFNENIYPSKSEREHIEDAGIKLQELANELFS